MLQQIIFYLKFDILLIKYLNVSIYKFIYYKISDT